MESQRFLQKMHVFVRKTKGDDSKLAKIIVRASDAEGNENNVTIYQESKYVFVAPEGKKQQALMYGNWEEALHATRRKIALCQPKSVAIDHYTI